MGKFSWDICKWKEAILQIVHTDSISLLNTHTDTHVHTGILPTRPRRLSLCSTIVRSADFLHVVPYPKFSISSMPCFCQQGGQWLFTSMRVLVLFQLAGLCKVSKSQGASTCQVLSGCCYLPKSTISPSFLTPAKPEGNPGASQAAPYSCERVTGRDGPSVPLLPLGLGLSGHNADKCCCCQRASQQLCGKGSCSGLPVVWNTIFLYVVLWFWTLVLVAGSLQNNRELYWSYVAFSRVGLMV